MPNFNIIDAEPSGARTATGAGVQQVNRSAVGAAITIKVTAVSGTTPTLVVKVQGSANGTDWYDVPGATTASITTATTTTIVVYPGVTVVANSAISQPLPRFWRLYWTIGGTTPSFTFSADAAMIEG